MRRSRPVRVTVVLAALAALLATACGPGSPPDEVTWRNIEVDLPDGWHVFEQTDDRLSISNVDLARHTEDGTFPDADVVAMFFTHEPGTLPGDWRALVGRLDAEIEADDRLVLRDEVPATRLVIRTDGPDAPTREMVVLIPSRQVVVLAQPVPAPGQLDAPEVFLDHVGLFLEVLETAEFGRPVLDD